MRRYVPRCIVGGVDVMDRGEMGEQTHHTLYNPIQFLLRANQLAASNQVHVASSCKM